jgi:hypothetical protein
MMKERPGTSSGESGTARGGVEAFTYRRARSGSITFVIALLILVETSAFHALLWSRLPWVAGSLTAMSLAVLAWLVADYRAMGRDAFHLRSGELDLRIGRRLTAQVPTAAIASAIAPTWRNIPQPCGDYLNATKPSAPNVLLTFREPVPVRAVGGIRRSVRRLGLCVDDPDRLLAALAAPAEEGK